MLFAGSAALAVAISPGPLPFYWTPLFTGIIYLGLVAVGGRGDGYWSAALVISCWGATVVAISSWELPIRSAAAYMVAVGVAALAAGALQKRGFTVSLTSLGSATVVSGLFFALDRYWADVLGQGRTYAVLLAVWGAMELALALRLRARVPAVPPG
ncbi:MAG: hypothetical protein WKF43_02815 [Acidimicrobiales bacterium]